MEFLLKEGHRDIGLTIITHSFGHLEAAVAERGLAGHVRLLRSSDLQAGERFNIPPIGAIAELKAADCLISMGKYEASPNVLIEAFAAGLPVIVCDTAEHRQMVVEGQTGFFVQTEDARELVQAVLKMKNNRELWRRMAASAAEKGREYDWDKTARGYAVLYEDALASRGAR